MTRLIKKTYNWFKRFRHRCGYGVHSPSDFFLITSVIYEKLPYYAYKKLAEHVTGGGDKYRIKIYNLLFRLINYFKPNSVIDIACDNGLSQLYMSEASKNLICYSFKSIKNELDLNDVLQLFEKIKKIDCIHIGFTPYYKEIFDLALNYIDEKSIIIVGTPYSSTEKKHWWEEVKNDSRVVITFDLYDIGIITFPEKRYKQNYVVNFL